MKTSISADLTVDPNNIKIKVKDIKENKNKEVNANITIVGTLVPKIDEEKLSKQISGKSFKKAEEILERLPQVSGVDINLSFNVPFFSSEPIMILLMSYFGIILLIHLIIFQFVPKRFPLEF